MQTTATTTEPAQSHTMTDAEWTRMATTLKGRITRARNKVREQGALADKLKAKDEVRAAEDVLQKHKLNYFDLVRG